MSEPKWTPGSWKIDTRPFEHAIEGRDGETVCLVDDLPGGVGVANARLLRAAPELYRATASLLDAADHLLRFLGTGWQSQDAATEGQEAIEFATRILGQARGEQ